MNNLFTAVLAGLLLTVSAVTLAEDCSDAINTIDMNECLSSNFTVARTEMNNYLQASLDRYAHDPELIQSINVAQKDWDTYRTSNCDAVHTKWRRGTIRDAMAISCGIRLTEQRTHELWENYLTFADSTPPVLPEPQ
ncbi:hypothetical protein BGP77_15730 [Saccharospirillum sp. MSK14-1]|nr:hypothetical protein BGP77_15730 [Saccharospirillum sp. MSK14-1]